MVATAPGKSADHRTRPPSSRYCPHQKNSTPKTTVSATRVTISAVPLRRTASLSTSAKRKAVSAASHTPCRHSLCQRPGGSAQISS